MATITAAGNGVFSTGATWTGGVVPAGNNIADSNNYAISITQNVSCTSIQNTTGGGFTVPTGTQNITIAANVVVNSAAVCLTLSHTAGTVTVDGNVTAGATVGISKNATGTLEMTGRTITGGSGTSAYGIQSTSGIVTLTNCTIVGGSGGNSAGFYHNNTVTNGSTITGGSISATAVAITGHGMTVAGTNGKTMLLSGVAITGGSAALAFGIRCTGATNTLSISGGSITGGTFAGAIGIANEGASPIPIDGCTITGGGGALSYGLLNQSTGLVTITNSTLINKAAGCAVAGGILFVPGATNYIEYPYHTDAGDIYKFQKTVPAAQMLAGRDTSTDGGNIPTVGTYSAPTAAQVESGVNFGPDSSLVGTLTTLDPTLPIKVIPRGRRT